MLRNIIPVMYLRDTVICNIMTSQVGFLTREPVLDGIKQGDSLFDGIKQGDAL